MFFIFIKHKMFNQFCFNVGLAQHENSVRLALTPWPGVVVVIREVDKQSAAV